MAQETFPLSYKDAAYDALDDASAKQVGINPALLKSVRLNGERSNADQVSSAGARTPYQFTPKTRQLIIDKYGIDPWLNPSNASLGGAYLLKESQDRNKGNEPAAVTEYHGGTDPANHGPITRTYVNRVMSGVRKAANADQAAQTAAQDEGLLSFARSIRAPSAVQSGAEAALSAATGSGDAQAAAPAQGSPEDLLDFAKSIRAPEPSLGQRIGDIVTGNLRETEETRTLPDWATMPELNQLSLASAKTGLGTLLAGPEEISKIIKSNFPDAKVRQDEKGNYLITSPTDGKEYAIKPGFQVSDIPRAIGALAAFSPAGAARTVVGQGAAAAGTQAAIEATQAATGGEFNGKDVAAAGALGAAVPAVSRVAGAVGNAVRGVAGRGARPVEAVAGRVEPSLAPAEGTAARAAEAAPEGDVIEIVGNNAPSAAAPAPAPTATPAAPLPASELNAAAKKAAEGGIGSSRARQTLAEQSAPDAETVAAAERLGIADNLQPDHITTNQAYRELAQAVKSVPGSEARAAEIQGLEAVAKRADDLVSELGGTDDLSSLSTSIRQRMQSSQTELEEQANKLYSQIREAVPAQSPAPARNVLEFIEQRAKDLGGRENLSPIEKMVAQKLGPRAGKEPTYTLLDDVRKDIGAAARQAGAFKDADTGLAKRLYNLVTKDQELAIEPYGASDLLTAAKAAVSTRKALEDDMVALFGKNLGDSVVGDISRSVSALGKGDTSQFLRLIQSVPKDLRQQVAASGLNYALGKGAKSGTVNFNTFARWYEGLQKNQQAYNALMANLAPEARQSLRDFYRVADGISKATRERITTGRIQAVQQELKGADGLIARIYDVAKRSATGLAAEAVTAPIGLPGAGISAGIASALTKGKPDVLKAADKVISSPEFIAIAKSVERGETPKASTVRQLAKSGQVRDFVKRLNSPEEMRDHEKWLMSLIQSSNETQH